jgi:hypothetical protein
MNARTIYKSLAAIDKPTDWPAPESDFEDWIFAAAAVIFVEPLQSEGARALLRNALGGKELLTTGRSCILGLKSRTTSESF